MIFSSYISAPIFNNFACWCHIYKYIYIRSNGFCAFWNSWCYLLILEFSFSHSFRWYYNISVVCLFRKTANDMDYRPSVSCVLAYYINRSGKTSEIFLDYLTCPCSIQQLFRCLCWNLFVHEYEYKEKDQYKKKKKVRIKRIVQVLQNCMIENHINTICACMYRYILNIHAMQTHPLLNPPFPPKKEK